MYGRNRAERIMSTDGVFKWRLMRSQLPNPSRDFGENVPTGLFLESTFENNVVFNLNNQID